MINMIDRLPPTLAMYATFTNIHALSFCLTSLQFAASAIPGTFGDWPSWQNGPVKYVCIFACI